jgi:4-hydroxythreonine-4-phosphate dehydrogenase
MDVAPGAPTKASGRTTGQALEKAIELCVSGKVHGMVTAPASKTGLHLAGYDFPGQTELVTLLSRSTSVLMMLVSKKLRVGLTTIHSPLKDVPYQISTDKVAEKATIMHSALEKDFGVARPRIAVLGLNPHAGENGHIGTEERDIIAPAIAHVSSKGMRVEGPFPADGFFGSGSYRSYDGVLAMYHDQGLVALKLLAFGKAVNVSAGLSIIRTSPDHGTAYDIAWKGSADHSSMVEAMLLAASIAKRRRSG